jgi:hypothetical protein
MATTSWILAEFDEVDRLIAAGRAMRAQGHLRLETYSPYPLHGVDEALGWGPSKVPFIALGGAIAGGSLGYLMQYFMNAVDYPLNIGNRMLNSVPAFVPITFETTILFTGVIMFLGLFALNGMPRLHHPVFESEAFRSATLHGFWLSVEVPRSEQDEAIAQALRGLGAKTVEIVAEEA